MELFNTGNCDALKPLCASVLSLALGPVVDSVARRDERTGQPPEAQ